MFILYIVPSNPVLANTLRHAAAEYLSKPIHERDAGFDLYSDTKIIGGGLNSMLLSQNVRAAVYDTVRGYFRAYWLLPRSSISKTPLRLANSVGLIDAGYRGTLFAAIDNMGSTYVVKDGDNNRLFQIAAPDLSPWEDIRIVSEIPGGETLRGEGGFGSTGVAAAPAPAENAAPAAPAPVEDTNE